MATAIPDLWPTDLVEPMAEPTPVSILRHQADLLGERTRNFVTGEVDSKTEVHAPNRQSFLHTFHLSCPLLGYFQPLILVRHDITPYPARVCPLKGPGEDGSAWEETATNADEFVTLLQRALARPEVRRVVNSLISQSHDADDE